MVENLYGCSIGTKSPYKLKPYGQTYMIIIIRYEVRLISDQVI